VLIRRGQCGTSLCGRGEGLPATQAGSPAGETVPPPARGRQSIIKETPLLRGFFVGLPVLRRVKAARTASTLTTYRDGTPIDG